MIAKFLLLTLFLQSNTTDLNVVYITVDDGPSVITDKICNILKEYNAKATFFVLGQNVKKYPQMLKLIHNEGHLIGSHTYSHINFYKIHDNRKLNDLIISEIKKTENEIFNVIRIKPIYLRYPYGYISKEAKDIAHKMGYIVINWDFGCDWSNADEDELIKRYLKHLKPKTILLIHDNPRRDSMVLRILKNILEEGKKRNIIFKRLDEHN